MSDLSSEKTLETQLMCPYCQNQVDDFRSHIDGGFKNGEKSSCTNCDLAIPNEQCLSSHIQIVHKDAMKVFSCETCNIDFSSKKYLFKHKDLDIHLRNRNKSQNEDVIVKAEFDEDQQQDLFEVKEEIFEEKEQAVVDNIPSANERFKCFECDKSFKRKSAKNHHHETVHLRVKNYKCEMCENAFFSQKSNLTTHYTRCFI